MRAFLALAIEPALRERLAETAARLGPGLVGVRFVRPEGIHLTLRFLGACAADRLRRLEPALAAAAGACPAAQARVSGLGIFPERGRPRVLWIGVAAPARIAELQAACERAARGAGFAPEPRGFSPHLTLARWREPASRPELPPADLGETRLERLVLYRSELRADGARYTELAGFPLAAPA